MKDLYKTLGVEASASAKEIKKAYHNLAKNHHPDKNDGEESKEFIEITFAYNILKDKFKRKQYDETGNCESGYDIRREAIHSLARLFLQIAKDSGWDYETSSIFEVMRVNLSDALGGNSKNDRKLCLAIERLEAIGKRVSGKDTMFNDIINNDLKAQVQAREMLQLNTDMLKEALKILKDYKYKTDGLSFVEYMTTSTGSTSTI
jgi:DnaJ-class molecular chaperone